MENGDIVLYNTKTRAAAVVTKENNIIVNNIFLDPDKNMNSEFFQTMLKHGFLVDSNKNEYSEIKAKYDSDFSSEKMLNIVILPAEMCNFSCPYCFIYNFNGKIMSDDIYENIKNILEVK
jgi:uncharacterized protein